MIAQDLPLATFAGINEAPFWTDRPQEMPPAMLMLEVDKVSDANAEILRQIQQGRPVQIVIVPGKQASTRERRDMERDTRIQFALGRSGGLTESSSAVLRCRVVGTPAQEQTVVRTGELEIDLQRGFVTLRGAAVRLSRTEYRLLEVLAQHPGKTLTTHELLRGVFGAEARKTDHYLRMYIMLLRRRLETHVGRPRYILTDRNRGYRLSHGESGDEECR